MLRNKYIKVLGRIITGDVVMFTLFSLFSKFFTGVVFVCSSYLALKSKFGYRERWLSG